MSKRTDKPITERELRGNFEKIQRDVHERIREYEQRYPELADSIPSADDVVRQPIYTYQIHAVS